jgi:hypothetical protein
VEEAEAQSTQADAPAASATEGSSGESGALETAPQAPARSDLDLLIRGVSRRESASKPADAEADGESAPQGDVKPSEGQRQRDERGRFLQRVVGTPDPPPPAAPDRPPDPPEPNLGRRGAAERIADLERQLAERDPEKIRAEVLAEQQREAEQAAINQKAVQDAERFEKLRDTPDHLLSAEDYAWREDQKELIARYPDVRDFLTAQADRVVRSRIEDAEQKQSAFWNDVKGQMARLASRKGVDQSAYGKLGNFEQMGGHLYDAGARSRDDEVVSLERQLREARAELDRHAPINGARGLGSGRSPLPAGRSGGNGTPSPEDQFDAFIRGTLRR